MRARGGKGASSAGQGRKLRSWLAIGLLLLQVAVTAGHFHPEDFAFAGGRAPALAATGAGGGTSFPGGQPVLPAHDDCSLCFSLQLAGGSMLPDAVALPLPSPQGPAAPEPLAELRLLPAPHLLFQTRAPPIA